jgi:ketosteroid isomerase-like protein
MSSRDSLAIIETYFERLAAGDRERLREMFAPDVAVHYHGPEGLVPWFGDYEGVDGYDEFTRRVIENVEHFEVDWEAPVVDGDTVVLLGHGVWRLRASGVEVRAHTTNVFRIVDGRIREYRVYNDTAAFAEAFGTLHR